MNSPQKQALGFLLLLLAIFLPACGGAAVPDDAAQEPIQIKVQNIPLISLAPLHIAAAEGYFEEQNLEVEFIEFNRSSEAIPLLAAGKLDVMAGSISPGLINAILREQNIKIVAAKGHVEPGGCSYMALLKSTAHLDELSDPGDLAGKPIRTGATGATAYIFDQALLPYGMYIEDTEVINLGQPVTGQALGDGSLYAALLGEPHLTQSILNGQAVIWYGADELTPDLVFGVITFGPTILEDNPEVGQRFMVAYLKGVRQYNEGKTERNLEILQESTGLEYEVLQQICLPPIREDGYIDFTLGLEPFLQWSLEKGQTEGMVTAAQVIDTSFIEYANEYLENINP
jgi:NitT/TauT family transport system substrate-binding protein